MCLHRLASSSNRGPVMGRHNLIALFQDRVTIFLGVDFSLLSGCMTSSQYTLLESCFADIGTVGKTVNYGALICSH